jgi:hypothetical protein
MSIRDIPSASQLSKSINSIYTHVPKIRVSSNGIEKQKRNTLSA